MQITVTDTGTLGKQITLVWTPEEVAARRAQTLKRMAGEVRLDGFRPGKASPALLEKRFGAAATQATEERLGDEGLSRALKEHDLRPIGPITPVETRREAGFSLAVAFEVQPKVAIPDPQTLQVADPPVELPEAELEEQLKALCRRAGQMAPLTADETVIEDDSITVSGLVTSNGKEARKLHDFNHLVGGYPFFGTAPAQVVELLKNRKVGDEVSFSTVLPASFAPAEFANQSAEVKVTIQAATRLRAAEANDELAKRLGVESLAKLRELMKARMQQARENEKRGKQIEELTAKLLAQCPCELPPKLLAASVKDAEEAAVKRLEAQGKKGEEFEAARKQAATDAERSLHRFIVLAALAEKLKVQVSERDLSDQVMMAAAQTRRKPEEVAKQLRESGRVDQVVHEIREAKAVEILLDQVLGKAAPAKA